jgi:hypothetical protein
MLKARHEFRSAALQPQPKQKPPPRHEDTKTQKLLGQIKSKSIRAAFFIVSW